MNSSPLNNKKRTKRNKSSQNNRNPHKSTTPSIDNKQSQNKKRRKRRNRKRNKNKASSSQKNKPTKKLLSIDCKPNQCRQCPESKISENIFQQTTYKQIDEEVITTKTTKTEKLAAPKIIDSDNNYIVMLETHQIYEQMTLPFIMKYKYHKSSLWIYKMSNHTKNDEKHLKLYGDEYFIAYIHRDWIKGEKHCDPKKYPDPNEWVKHKQTDTQYLRIMAIVNTKKYNNLLTLRDIRGDLHYKLLNHIKITLCDEIGRIYGVKRDKLKIYLHYKPTALLLHIHFVHINNYKQHIQNYRDHFIDDILKKIKDKSDYYKYKILPHQIYFDSKREINNIFAKHTKDLINMKGKHPWYDKKMLSQTTKRPINRSIDRTMDDDDEKKLNDDDDKKNNKFRANKSNPMNDNNYQYTNYQRNKYQRNSYQYNNYQYDDDDDKLRVNKSNPIKDDKKSNKFRVNKSNPINDNNYKYQRNSYQYNNYQYNNNQYDDDDSK